MEEILVLELQEIQELENLQDAINYWSERQMLELESMADDGHVFMNQEELKQAEIEEIDRQSGDM